MEKVEKRLQSLEKQVKELKSFETEANKFLGSWNRYFEARDKKDEERDKAINNLCELLGEVQKLAKSKPLKEFLEEANKRQKRGREIQKSYVS